MVMFWTGFEKQAMSAGHMKYLKSIGAFKKKPSAASRMLQASKKTKGLDPVTQQGLKEVPRANPGRMKYVDIR
jgi:hypothetical protein